MATMILAAVVVVLAAALVWQNRHRLPVRRPRTPQVERTVECVTCGRRLPVSEAVVVADVGDDAEEAEFTMGGTACVAEYCPEHAP